MSVCHFCGADNEEWMKICQECGNPVLDNSKSKDNPDDDVYNSSYDEDAPKNSNNMDLKIIIAILSVILIGLIIYTITVVL